MNSPCPHAHTDTTLTQVCVNTHTHAHTGLCPRLGPSQALAVPAYLAPRSQAGWVTKGERRVWAGTVLAQKASKSQKMTVAGHEMEGLSRPY